MKYSLQLSNFDMVALSKNWGLFLTWGIVLIILGAIAIGVAALTTLVSVIFLGILIFISGIVIVIDTFKFWWRRWSGFFFHLLMGILYLIAGAMLIKNPVSSAISLTLILAVFYILLGVFRIISALMSKFPNWSWRFFNGVIALFLGLLIMAHWPASSLFIIGLFVGIDLMFSGLTYAMLAISARGFVGKVE